MIICLKSIQKEFFLFNSNINTSIQEECLSFNSNVNTSRKFLWAFGGLSEDTRALE